MNAIAKKTFYSGLFLFALLAFSMCDYVKEPYQNLAPIGSSANAIIDSMTGTLDKKIFIEDYTGHTCGNCPKAVDTINTIYNLYPGRVIAVGIHSGYYSALQSPDYTYNFVLEDPVTPGYNELDNFFQISANGNPNGMVNRKEYDASTQTHIKGIDQWRTYAAQVMQDTVKVQLSLMTSTDTVTAHSVVSTIKVKYLYNLSGDYKLAAFIIEDSVEKPQKDYRFNPDDILDYTHRHVLRGYMYGAFGEQVGAQNPLQNSTDTKTYAITIPSSIARIKHCALVAYVYNAATYEVLQAEELELIPH
ncbi:MAG: Omp28-related outer membrane protein [Bacteroidia bacterium]|nr:Omp28-related outer membrane protein [Bacteroidia bacterium]